MTVLSLAVLAAACGPARATTTTEPAPGLTIVTTELQQTWDSAIAPTPVQADELQEALTAHGIVLLRPVTHLVADSDATADVSIVVRQPAGTPFADLTIRGGGLTVVISLQTTRVANQPACAERRDGGWVPLVVRGADGCGLLVPGAVSSIDWIESDQWFHAEFGPDLEPTAVIDWLTAWVEA